MIILYGLILMMLIGALGLLAVPFIHTKMLCSRSYLLLALFTIALTLGIYQISGDKTALRAWFTQGQAHYQLLTQFDALGGIDGMIKHIEAKLKDNPNDAQGWLILAKLYAAKHEDAAAKRAYQRAEKLQSELAHPTH